MYQEIDILSKKKKTQKQWAIYKLNISYGLGKAILEHLQRKMKES